MAGQEQQQRRRVIGVDFSGAQDCGKRMWLAEGFVEDGLLTVESCFPVSEIANGRRKRTDCLQALVEYVGDRRDCVVGMDFPFGLPAKVVSYDNWTDFVQAFPTDFEDADQFKEKCYERGGRRELRRDTDVKSGTPFSPYNLRLYRQTYHGIGCVLHPLVSSRKACVLPMQERRPGVPWVVEICPASTLKAEGLYYSYKGSQPEFRDARERILEELEKKGLLRIGSQEVKQSAIIDRGGDALDSIVAAVAARRALSNPDAPNSGGEGYVYV